MNPKPSWLRKTLLFIYIAALLAGCTTAPAVPETGPLQGAAGAGEQKPTATAGIPTLLAPFLPPTRAPGSPLLTPTPDAPRVLPTMRAESETYIVASGDTLAKIAQSEGVGMNDIIRENQLDNPDLLSVGQALVIPPPTPKPTGPGNKLLPDSELVYGPVSAYFNAVEYINSRPGYIRQYTEEIDGQTYTAAQVLMRIAQEYSVNPRLLLAVMEYRSQWLSNPRPDEDTLDYPAGYPDGWRIGLYRQLAWAANQLNRGYYLWRVNAVSHWMLSDGSYVPPDAQINAGTAGVQQLMSQYFGYEQWKQAVSDQGFITVYRRLFGEPFDFSVEPLLPASLAQPDMILPFENNTSWSFTGGPHAGWADGSAWAALDFAPPGEALGCVQSDAWVTAVAPGVITRAGNGEVIQDLDGDGLEGTGWVVLYMHIETRDRIRPGTQVQPGDKIGHPSCEGGVSSGTHLHLARRYNGEWIPADGNLPFTLDGWISQGYGSEYDGILRRDDTSIEAWVGRKPENQIQR